MLYGPQNIFGSASLTPTQRAAQQKRREAAARIAEAARVQGAKADATQEETPSPTSSLAATVVDAMTAETFFAAAWRMLNAPHTGGAIDKRPIVSWPVQKIQETVCAYYHVSMAELVSPSRAQELAGPRQVAMYLSRILTGRSLPEIGRRFGQRRHTTVLHAVRVISARLPGDARLKGDIAAITERLKAQGDRAP
jgi:hypothetical protein